MPQDDTGWTDEFDLIKRLLKIVSGSSEKNGAVVVPPGDDAALLTPLSKPVITTDTQREGIHFSLDWQSPEEIGCKAVEIAFSDLAASYAEPVAVFVNLSIPSHISVDRVEQLYQGLHRALERSDAVLAGGNVSGASQLALDLFAVGHGDKDLFPRRSDARIGDGLYCTGPIGLARGGLAALQRNDMTHKVLIEKFKFPKARFDAAKILRTHKVRCVTDISDGLSGDAGHIATASRLTIAFDLSACPVAPELTAFCSRYDVTPEQMILSGGEDYELLFACSPDVFKSVHAALPEAFPVGRCIPFNGRHLSNLPEGVSSFQHGNSIH